MKTNLGIVDKLVRMFVAAVLAVICLQLNSTVGLIAGASSLLLMGTVAMSWCPVYNMFGFKTCEMKEV